MRFHRIVVIGAGRIACDCIRTLYELAPDALTVIESAHQQLSMVRAFAAKRHLPYEVLTEKEDIHRRLTELAGSGPTLIVSANNRYIFTQELIGRENVEIINFHYGYLPHYRGMNIPTWTIYNGEPYTGVTWHHVTAEVDHGRILAQEKIPIGEHTTAFDVVREGMRIGQRLFAESIPAFLAHPMAGREISYPDEPVYRFRELPGDGFLDVMRSTDDIYRHLRSFDYGRPELFFPLRVRWHGEVYDVTSYGRPSLTDAAEGIVCHDGKLTVVKDGEQISMALENSRDDGGLGA